MVTGLTGLNVHASLTNAMNGKSQRKFIPDGLGFCAHTGKAIGKWYINR